MSTTLQGHDTIIFDIKGAAPLLMSNSRLADPRDPFARKLKEFTGKRKRTDDDIDQMAELQFRGGLYLDGRDEPCLPARILEASFHNGARCKRKGKQFEIGCFILDDAPLKYDGPRDADGLWADDRFVLTELRSTKNGKTLVTCAKFDDWSARVTVLFNPEKLNREEVITAVRDAGTDKGVGSGRPRHGRFNITKIDGQPV